MDEKQFETLLKVATGNEINHTISYRHNRKPFYQFPGNGYGHGPTSGFVTGHTVDIRRFDNNRNYISISHDGVRSCGSVGIGLGVDRNQLDVCMWGVPLDAEIESAVFGAGEIKLDEGIIEHTRLGMFDRRVVVPILEGTLSLHLSQDEFSPTR